MREFKENIENTACKGMQGLYQYLSVWPCVYKQSGKHLVT